MHVQTFVIPNELCRRAGVAGAWRPINELALFPYEKRTLKQKDCPSNYASDLPSSVFNLRQEVVLFQPVLRKLVNESNGTFVALQSNSRDLIGISVQYRSIIRACLENLHEEIVKGVEDSLKEELENFVTIFYSIECVWHLCEILFLENSPGEVVLLKLLDWVRFHFPKHERSAAQVLSAGHDLRNLEEKCPDYWGCVLGNLLQGRVKVVRTLLRQHSNGDSPVFRLAEGVLRAMPVYSVSGGISVHEFQMQRQHWVVDVQTKIDAQLFVSNKYLHLMMRLIVGEEQAWLEMQQYSEAWYELLAGWLFYTQPTVKSFELGQFAQDCIKKMRIQSRLKHLDRVLLAAMELDVLQIIKEIQHMSDNCWFATHLTDLLFHAGRLATLEKEIDNFSSKKLHESFLLDYGTMLMGHSSLWQVGLNYLDHCPENGIACIELLLPRIALTSEAKTMKILREAKQRDLSSVVQSVCKVQGMQSLRRGRLGNALTWALKSQDGPFSAFLADKFLMDYIAKGQLSSTDLLDNLGSCMLASDRLIFLGKYFEFHKLYQSGDYQEAANLLISLLVSKIVPKYFWHVLLIEVIPLLESEELVLSSNDTFTILHCLEEKEHLEELKDKIDILRLAASRNLSRALIFEAQYE